jgi:hypothetical protein
MGGGRIVPRSLKTKGNKKFLQPRPKIVLFLNHLLYLLKIFFPKLDQLTVTGMALCVDLGPKFQNLFCLV